MILLLIPVPPYAGLMGASFLCLSIETFIPFKIAHQGAAVASGRVTGAKY